MTISEAVHLVLYAATMGEGDDVFILDMGEPVKIDDLARQMIQLAGLTPGVDVNITYTGLRPGEKLYEELWTDAEEPVPTNNPGIRKTPSGQPLPDRASAPASTSCSMRRATTTCANAGRGCWSSYRTSPGRRGRRRRRRRSSVSDEGRAPIPAR